MRTSLIRGLLSSALALLLLLDQSGLAQATQPLPRHLEIVILEGEGALNNVSQRTAREPIVQVQDENHKPVAGAIVFFTINGQNGAGGSFLNEASTFQTTTDAEGKAIGRGFHANGQPGSISISVSATVAATTAVAATVAGVTTATTATSGAGSVSTGFTVIHQANFLPKPAVPAHAGVFSGTVAHVPAGIFAAATAVVVAGVVVGVTVATHNNNKGTITPGGGTVGAP